MGDDKILQFSIGADGWRAVYEEEGAERYTSTLVGFVLVEEPDGTRYITGFDLDESGITSLVTDDTNFVGYRRGYLPGEQS